MLVPGEGACLAQSKTHRPAYGALLSCFCFWLATSHKKKQEHDFLLVLPGPRALTISNSVNTNGAPISHGDGALFFISLPVAIT